MFIVYGWSQSPETIGEGNFICPSCQRRTQYNHLQMRSYITFFFIPVIPLGAGERVVQCRVCELAFVEDVLSLGHSATAEPQTNVIGSGDRILAKRGGYWYTGVSRGRAGNRIKVRFDDGKQDHLTKELVIPLDLREEDPIYARGAESDVYWPGTITAIEESRVQIRFDDGRQEWTKFADIRVVWADDAGD